MPAPPHMDLHPGVLQTLEDTQAPTSFVSSLNLPPLLALTAPSLRYWDPPPTVLSNGHILAPREVSRAPTVVTGNTTTAGAKHEAVGGLLNLLTE